MCVLAFKVILSLCNKLLTFRLILMSSTAETGVRSEGKSWGPDAIPPHLCFSAQELLLMKLSVSPLSPAGQSRDLSAVPAAIPVVSCALGQGQLLVKLLLGLGCPGLPFSASLRAASHCLAPARLSPTVQSPSPRGGPCCCVPTLDEVGGVTDIAGQA